MNSNIDKTRTKNQKKLIFFPISKNVLVKRKKLIKILKSYKFKHLQN